ncbi:hypothetical protein E2C01_033652 [Portunus trituberculatus]|uniref:Uncharacterized protein n=1 Tax=Portunus trituberculatus TaxID=210409 RepID=A0A5B7F4C2_PORTR|nr:hypothetical protein [Portunus trituberculatus]
MTHCGSFEMRCGSGGTHQPAACNLRDGRTFGHHDGQIAEVTVAYRADQENAHEANGCSEANQSCRECLESEGCRVDAPAGWGGNDVEMEWSENGAKVE